MALPLTLSRRPWLIPAALIALSLIPVVAGMIRIAEIGSAPAQTPDNARFLAAPVVSVLHAGGAGLFLILGALQFAPGPRGRWHRMAGRLAVGVGLIGAGSGIAMTLTFPAEPSNGLMLQVFRLAFGPAWGLCLILGLAAARRRDIATHRAWMIRAQAIALGGGTTVITFGLWFLITGRDTPTASALAQLAAWVGNLWIAERIITQRHFRRIA